MSKIERGQRKATRAQVVRLAEYYHVEPANLVKAWLSDKIVHDLENEAQALEVLKVAEEKVAYKSFQKTDRKRLIQKIKTFLKQSGKIDQAWIFGSFARGDDGPLSDIDIAVKTDNEFSYFDLAEIQYGLESVLKRNIDIGFLDSFKPYIFEHIKPDLKLIYER